jgi:hypothetical protein
MNATIKTAELIRQYNPALAECWIRQPYRRLDLANAFAAGFSEDQYGDLPAVCWAVIRSALADSEARQSMIGT